MSDRDSLPAADLLLAHHAWVRKLARSLVEDECQADDLVQEAWLVTHRTEPVSIRRPKEWLAGVLRNLARQSWRGETRRRQREESAHPGAGETTIERATLGRELAGEVLALDEPFRTVLLLRFYEDLPPRVIAKRTGAPVATVDSRIARGLAKVRKRWKRKRGDEATWLPGLILVAQPHALSPFASARTEARPTAISSSATGLGAITMNVKLGIAATIVIASGLIWQQWDRESERPRIPERDDRIASTLTTTSSDEAALPVDLAAAGAGVVEARRRGLATVGHPETDLVVQVIDARSRKPLAGVPLVLHSDPAQPAPGDVATTSTTDTRGIAALRNARRFLRGQPNPWFLVHDIPFEKQPTLLLTSQLLAEDIVVSEQPASGSIEVVDRGPDGTPPDGDRNTQLLLLNADKHATSWKGEVENGSTVFRYVELGRSWEARVRANHSSITTKGSGPGPTLPDTLARIAVASGQDVLTFRALDPLGRPLVEVPLRVTRFRFLGQERAIEVTTDPKGSFTLEDPRAGGSVLVQYTTTSGIELSGDAELAFFGETESTDIRDITLVEDGLLASGWVVDEGGKPVSDAMVFAGRNPRFPHVRKDAFGFGLRFGRSQEVGARTDAEGRFELLGKQPTPKFKVWAYKDNLRSEPLTVDLGENGLSIALAPVWMVSGSLVVDDGAPPWVLRVTLRSEADEKKAVATSAEGHFVTDAVRSGPYTLLCTLGENELARRNVLVVDGDVDVGEINLRSRLHRHEIIVLDATPPPRRVEVSWRPCGAEGPLSKDSFQGTRGEVWAPTDCIDAWVSASGFRTEVIWGLSGRGEVRLRSPLSVRLVLRTNGDLPQPPYVLTPHLNLDGKKIGNPIGLSNFSDPERELVFLLPAPGEVQLTWGLYRPSGNGSGTTGGGILADHGVTFEVMDQVGEQVFEVELDGDALSKAVGDAMKGIWR